MQVPLLDLKRQYLYLKFRIDHRIKTALEHQNWILGPEVKELETTVARYIGTRYALGCASGTDALVLALRALAYRRTGQDYFSPEDEIITTPFTFVATADAILRAHATPVFVDIDPQTYQISAEKVRAAVTPRTVGIIPVHLYGTPAPMREIKTLAEEFNLFVLEDCAQAFGAAIGGKRCGAWGDAAAFSFFPSKNLGGFGDGGMVTTDDETLAYFVDILRRHGGRDKYNVDRLGYNSRLDTIQAAVLLARFSVLDEFNGRRRSIALAYNQALDGLPGITVPRVGAEIEQVFHQYTIRYPARDRLKAALESAGVATMVYYPVALHSMKLFAGRCRVAGELTEAERACREVLSLPIEPLLEPEEVNFVIEQIHHCVQNRQTAIV